MAKGGKGGKRLSAKQKAYLGANVWVHTSKGKVNKNASVTKNRSYMKSPERKKYLQSYKLTKAIGASKKASESARSAHAKKVGVR